jgi:hypothetical protein
MTKSNYNKIKKFKRLLKDIGIYQIWYKERIKWVKYISPGIVASKGVIYTAHIVVTAYATISLGELINNSFNWYGTSDENLWAQLHESVIGYSIRDIEKMEEGVYSKFIKKIKKQIGYG